MQRQKQPQILRLRCASLRMTASFGDPIEMGPLEITTCNQAFSMYAGGQGWVLLWFFEEPGGGGAEEGE